MRIDLTCAGVGRRHGAGFFSIARRFFSRETTESLRIFEFVDHTPGRLILDDSMAEWF